MKITKPAVIIINGDTPFFNSVAENNKPTMASTAPGNKISPVMVGGNSNTLCASTGVRNTDVNNPKPVTNVNIAATASDLLLSTRKSITGFGVVNSHQINVLKAMTAMS